MSASVSEQSFKQYYQHTLNDWVLCFSMINGVVPLGGMVGSMTLPYVMRFTTKRYISSISIEAFILSFLDAQLFFVVSPSYPILKLCW